MSNTALVAGARYVVNARDRGRVMDDIATDLELLPGEEVCPECHMVRWAATGPAHCGCNSPAN